MKTNITKIITILSIVISNFTFGQFENYGTFINPNLSEDSIQNGCYYFNESNTFLPGQVFERFKAEYGDDNDEMILKSQHTDHLVNYTHYRYEQYYKEIPVEGAFYIEHFTQDGKLDFVNGKVATYINQSSIPTLNPEEAVSRLIDSLQIQYEGENLQFAWEDSDWEHQMQDDSKDSNATWYPTAKPIWAIDTLKNMGSIVSGSRYTLAYKIPITIIEPEYKSLIYFVDANTGEILKYHSTSFNDGPGEVYGYGTKVIDTRWKGGFPHGHYYLRSNNNTREVWTKEGPSSGNGVWFLISNVKDDDDQWHNADKVETSAYYNVCTSWDFYKEQFGRTGMDDNSAEVRVKTNWNDQGKVAQYRPPHLLSNNSNKNYIVLGKNNGIGYGSDPSIVAHEYTHGIIWHTTELYGNYESGALNESFSDIFGLVIQAKKYDNGVTDWIVGNTIPGGSPRSLKAPKSYNQPDTYEGEFWQAGDVHADDGVQNHWFYLLTQGGNGQNDNGDYYNISQGIGIHKSANIAYLAMTSLLGPSSKYINSRQETINAAKMLYGKCSVEYQTTKNAWYAVGVGSKDDCSYTASISEFDEKEIVIYPNPARNNLIIDMPLQTKEPILIKNVMGDIVQSIDSNSKHVKIDVSALSKGIYFVDIILNNNRITKKIIIQ